MNLHLSIFRPYQREAGHEDQLTRAALITMRMVPLAHEAFLSLADCPGLAALPPARFDMQTGRLVAPDTATDEPETVDEIVSVFLAPHESVGSGQPDIDSARTARYDGVLQYRNRLLIVIESKLFEGSSDWQSLTINTGGVTTASSRRHLVSWSELLDRWWNLTELDVLTAAERQVLTDFFDFAEEHFDWLLPFTSLERAGLSAHRRRRRLRTVLTEATGLPATEGGNRAEVMFGERVTSMQRAALIDDDDVVTVSMWPAEQAPQARHVYATRERVEALLALDAQAQWTVRPNFYVGYFNAPVSQRWYTRADARPIREYLEHWLDDLEEHVGRYPRAELEDDWFWAWLLDRGYAQEDDRPGLDRLLATRVQHFDVRPSVEVMRRWSWAEAAALDAARRLTVAVAETIDSVLAALDEPALAELNLDAGADGP